MYHIVKGLLIDRGQYQPAILVFNFVLGPFCVCLSVCLVAVCCCSFCFFDCCQKWWM